eukprot:CAMPEP_0202727324 /NCGR_PEP_ID=MMETSP1385-20130828/185064_1 /ASSEMBLY_ACC=CAM_ASM_000861 /TAXON_ID=933848 /ORGANISM="Elphidium margaritaceum" /LENGTH=502 /DNA_ID=CAMNT_0049393563 /DNA_START=72 /DNA_END=1580 /DNA_ORIENTATION=+
MTSFAPSSHVTPDSRTIVVTNIPKRLCKREILESPLYFGRFGPVQYIYVSRDKTPTDLRNPSKPKGIAYIEFIQHNSATAAVLQMNGSRVLNTQFLLHVRLAATAPRKGSCYAYFFDGQCFDRSCKYTHDIGIGASRTSTDSANSTLFDFRDVMHKLHPLRPVMADQNHPSLTLANLVQIPSLMAERNEDNITLNHLDDIDIDIDIDIDAISLASDFIFLNDHDDSHDAQSRPLKLDLATISADSIYTIDSEQHAQLQARHTDLQREHDQLRKKHCDLIRDYNILRQQCQKTNVFEAECQRLRQRVQSMTSELERDHKKFVAEQCEHAGAIQKYRQLKQRYTWLQREFEETQKSESELKKILFPSSADCSAPTSPSLSVSNDVIAHFKEFKHYRMWSCQDVAEWMLNVDGGRFKKYRRGLFAGLSTENVCGVKLSKLTEIDLCRVGVLDFEDRMRLLREIQTLITQHAYEKNSVQQYNIFAYPSPVYSARENDCLSEVEGKI